MILHPFLSKIFRNKLYQIDAKPRFYMHLIHVSTPYQTVWNEPQNFKTWSQFEYC